MMKPTKGRIVYFHEKRGEEIVDMAAIVTDVRTEEIVSLCVFMPGGSVTPMARVPRGTGDGTWDWMPYQKAKEASGDVNSESAEPRPESEGPRAGSVFEAPDSGADGPANETPPVPGSVVDAEYEALAPAEAAPDVQEAPVEDPFSDPDPAKLPPVA